MDALQTSLASALARALGETPERPLRPQDLARMSREDIERGLRIALQDAEVLNSITSPTLPSDLFLNMAKTGKHEAMIGALRHGAELNHVNAEGESALILATKAGAKDCVRLLLLGGIDMSISAPATGTALHLAARAGHEEMCLMLIDAGDDHGRLDAEGKSFVELMRKDSLAQFEVFAHMAEEYALRKRAAERLRLYVAGRLPSVYAPDGGRNCYIARPWTERSHRYTPPALREVVMMLLVDSWRRQGESTCLPPDVWVRIFLYMHRDFICETDLPISASSSSSASRPLQAQELRAKMSQAEEVLRQLFRVTEGDLIAQASVFTIVRGLEDEICDCRTQLARLQ
mmetsp:Transcript_101332/g.257721  ORF Transcript_101332/g.257721 Transcript_101332/m.257721 type:complete len:345 (-) Transcript_101332:121-1155(-)